jgi:hypothetical protein
MVAGFVTTGCGAGDHATCQGWEWRAPSVALYCTCDCHRRPSERVVATNEGDGIAAPAPNGAPSQDPRSEG